MRNDALEAVWKTIEAKNIAENKRYQRIICVDLLYRVYIGSAGIPSRRYMSIEIPKADEVQLDSFTSPKGFTLTLSEPSLNHTGYTACVLQAASHDQNDVFTILAQDILQELRNQKNADEYVKTLKCRIEKWRDFFRNLSRRKLTDQMVIGLWGELQLIQELSGRGISIGADIWNGPIKSAQDFQGRKIAVEVKTTAADNFASVDISSEMQLDDNGRETLFLAVFRVERNDAGGLNLPAMVEKTASALSEQQKGRFYAALLCLGYSPDDADLYDKKYSLREKRIYHVKDGFPRLLRSDLPQGVIGIKYQISLKSSAAFLSDIDFMISKIKEYEYEQN